MTSIRLLEGGTSQRLLEGGTSLRVLEGHVPAGGGPTDIPCKMLMLGVGA